MHHLGLSGARCITRSLSLSLALAGRASPCSTQRGHLEKCLQEKTDILLFYEVNLEHVDILLINITIPA